MLELLILSLLAGVLSLCVTGAVRHYALRTALLDIPNERSSHTQPTPRGGGLGFIISFAIASAIGAALPIYWPQLYNINQASAQILERFQGTSLMWLSLIPLAIIGTIDDRHNVSAALRYLVQLTAASIAIACFGPFPQPWLTGLGIAGTAIAIVLSVIAMTALINFYNFMDGLDGLVAGVTAVQLGFLGIYLNLPIFWLLVAALLGFLWWNWSPAKIFMGDAGSTVLGATVTICLLNSSDPLQAWSALAITLPLIGDAIYTLSRRLLRRENIFKAHRSHLYQRLQQSGWSHRRVAGIYIGFAILVATSIGMFGPYGAWMSLVGVVGGIILGEFYLGHR